MVASVTVSPIMWNPAELAYVYVEAPLAAHKAATFAAAVACSQAIGGHGRGELARQVRQPTDVAPFISEIGSDLPYAAIEQFGGTIKARNYPRMLIRGGPREAGGTGRFISKSSQQGNIVASATSVEHAGKHYLDQADETYKEVFARTLQGLI